MKAGGGNVDFDGQMCVGGSAAYSLGRRSCRNDEERGRGASEFLGRFGR
jgi:hypothetical protein